MSAPTVGTSPSSGRAITADLMARLERHYVNPADHLSGGVFLPETGWNGGTGTGRCDALYVGFTSASGRLLVGHEVKASRSDWLTELRHVGKADQWADNCHQWWLVTVPGVVADGELPASWGLMVPGSGRTRMKIVTKPRTFTDRTPSWDAVRSMMARMDTLQRNSIVDRINELRTADEARFEERVARVAEARAPKAAAPAELKAQMDRIVAALGGTIEERPYPGSVTEEELRLAGDWIRASRAVRRGNWQSTHSSRHQIRYQLEQVRDALEKLDELDAALARLRPDLAEAG